MGPTQQGLLADGCHWRSYKIKGQAALSFWGPKRPTLNTRYPTFSATHFAISFVADVLSLGIPRGSCALQTPDGIQSQRRHSGDAGAPECVCPVLRVPFLRLPQLSSFWCPINGDEVICFVVKGVSSTHNSSEKYFCEEIFCMWRFASIYDLVYRRSPHHEHTHYWQLANPGRQKKEKSFHECPYPAMVAFGKVNHGNVFHRSAPGASGFSLRRHRDRQDRLGRYTSSTSCGIVNLIILAGTLRSF